MRRVDYSTWRVFYSVFVQGAWSCLMQNIDVKARHSSFLRQVAVALCGSGAEEWERLDGYL